jgi:hypothetical protein
VEIIELLSDTDSPPPGDANNPIVLDSEDEADQRGSSFYPLLEVSQFTPRRKNIHPDPPSGSNHLARSHTSHSSSPDTSNTGDEFRDAESSSVQRASLPPQSEHSIDQSSVVNDKTYQTPLPIQDSSEIQDKTPNGVSENTREASPPVTVPSSPSPMSPKSRNKGMFDQLAISRISSSPNRSHLPPVDASASSSFVPVRGTLYGGRSGLWKGFFRVTTAGPASPSKPSRDIDKEEGDTRSKEASTPRRANSPRKITQTTLVSLAQNMSIRSSPTSPSVDGRGLEISDDPTITTLESVSSAVIGKPSR